MHVFSGMTDTSGQAHFPLSRLTHARVYCQLQNSVSMCQNRRQTQDVSTSDFKKVQVGKDQEKAQSEKDSHSKNRGGKKPN